jgi:hypothetical protein
LHFASFHFLRCMPVCCFPFGHKVLVRKVTSSVFMLNCQRKIQTRSWCMFFWRHGVEGNPSQKLNKKKYNKVSKCFLSGRMSQKHYSPLASTFHDFSSLILTPMNPCASRFVHSCGCC